MASAQTKILLSVGDRYATATLVDNDATAALLTQLAAGPITVSMVDYGGFEKVGELPQSLPTSNSQITTAPGDIMLYQGNNMVIFYGSNTWSYTRLGHIDNATADGVRAFLGSGDISLTLSLDTSAAIETVTADVPGNVMVCDLSGCRVTRRPLPSGICIIAGRKVLVRNN
ncbi:MAG: hypothetical protein K2H74_09785 [Paramuribaculum sp.]|nr:hypothetical protein [Paramuribaculum sp.]